jgi:hypothetical protein
MIAAEVKRGVAPPDDIAWLKEWKRRAKREQWQGVQAARTARAHREAQTLDRPMARDRDP